MKKFLTLFSALLLLGSMMTVSAKYCVAHNPNTLSSANWNAGAEEMTQIGTTGIYSITYNNVGTSQVQFKVTDGSWTNSWASYDNVLSEITLSTTGGNASFTLGSPSNVTIYFISSSKKIYVYTAGNIPYTIAGVAELMGSDWNTGAVAGNDMIRQSDGITYTLTRQNVSLSAGDKNYKVVKNHAWGTGEYPSSGNNKLNITSAGNYDVTFTYKPALASLTAVATPVVTPTVSFVNLPTTVGVGHTISFSAASQNISNPVYTFKVKKGSGAYGSAVTSYNFAEAGTYTVKVEADGDASAHTEATQDISVINGHVLYYVKTNSWSQINAYMWGDGTTAGMGLPMYLTSATTAKHNYPVYAVAFTQNYTGGLFNNGEWGTGNQTGDQTLNYSKPYYYNDEWFATLEECDPLAGVNFDGLNAQIAKGTAVTFAATSVGIESPTYKFYIRPESGSYGSAITSYTFNEVGKFVAKVEALENSAVVAYREKEIEVYTTYTFHNGDIIKVDFSDVSGDVKGVNFPFGDKSTSLDYNATGAGTVKTVTFTTNVEWSTLQDFIKTEKNGWTGLRFQLPVGQQDIAKVAADGASYYWTLEPAVNFSGMADAFIKNDEVALAATSNLTNVSFAYQVKIGEGEFTDIAGTAYTFAAAGNYTFKVTATGDEGNVSATKDVTVYNPLTLYFVNKEGWANVNLYLFDPAEKATWPGDPMTLTAETTDRNGYSVYSFVIPASVYAQAIFNNGSAQTSDLTINNSKPYYYDGEWYATLAECDQPVLTTNFYLAGSFNDWNTTSDRFMKVNESDTEASVTISITEYSNITFKVMEGAAYCGSSDAITKDANTATIAAAGAGNDIAMTPYAAGDYIFTLNLNTRVLTVTYPDGDAMPIPTNIFLAGEMNSWAPANNDYKFAVSGDIATLEVDLLAEQDYEFKLVYNSTWLRADYDFKYYWCSDVAFSAGDGNGAKIYTFKAGTYTFSYKISTGELSIAYPTTDATPVTIGALEYATFFSNKAFDVPADVEAYIITGNEGIKLTIEPIYRIPANTGVMLHAPAGTYDFYEGDGRWMDAVTNNKLKGSAAAEVIDNGEVHYVLSYNNDNQVGFYWPNGTSASQGKGAFTNGAGKAYLELSDAPAAAVVARRGFPLVVGAGTPTGIEEIESNAEQTKFIQNGQLLIQHNGLIFNAQGARVR